MMMLIRIGAGYYQEKAAKKIKITIKRKKTK